MADIATIGFRAQTDQLEKAENDLNALVPAAAKAETAMGRLGRKITEVGGTISGKLSNAIGVAKTALVGFVAGIAGAFSAGAILSSLSGIADRLDDVSKAASKLRVNAGDLQSLGYAADLAGVSFDELSTVANKMNKIIGTAIAKGKETEGVFKLLGISAKTLADLPIDKRFAAIADQMNAMNLSADQTALILGQLGDRAGALAPLFEGGSEAIREASEQLDRFGGKISNADGKNVEAMNDAFTSLGYSIQAAGNQFVVFLSNTGITQLINGVAEFVGWLNRSRVAIASLATSFIQLVPGLGPIINAVRGLSTLFQQVFGMSLTQAAKAGINFVINAVTGMYGYVKNILSGVPQLFSAAFYGGAAMALKAINSFVQNAIAAFNNLAAAVGAAFGVELGKTVDGSAYDMSNSDIYKGIQARADNAATAAKGVFVDANNALQAQMNVDNFASSVQRTKDDVVSTTPALTDMSGALDKVGGSAKGAAEQITELQKIGKELDAIGAPFDQAKSAFEKLRELQQNGIVTGDQYTAMLGRIQNAFIAAGGTAAQWGKIIGQQTIDMTAALKEFSTNALTSVGDAIADLAIEGKIDFKALADSIIRDMIRIMWQALVVKPIISAVFPGIGFADGGVFSNGALQPFAKGGVVSGPTLFQFADGGTMRNGIMGEAGAEAIMPLTRGQDGRLGVEAHGNGGQGGNVISIGDIHITQQSSGDSDKDRRHAAETGKQVRQQLEGVVLEVLERERGYGGRLNPRGVRG